MRALACCLAGCLALAGCGWGGNEPERAASSPDGRGGEPAGTAVPEPTAQPLTYRAGARQALAAGATAVVDVTKHVGVEPATMDVNRQQRVSGLRWTTWGAARAVGRGEVEILVCEPTCMDGLLERARATVVLSAPKRCAGRRYYTRSSMTYVERETGKTRAPATYLRTPC